ncbi:MAG: nucleotidyltransferase family protein [Pseudomonadota bacterium]
MPDTGVAPQRAMILAAGFGKRMRPITDRIPKPMVEVQGRTLLDTILDRLDDQGIDEVVINLHYLGEKIQEHLAARPSPRIIYSPEVEILETGGGVKAALDHLGNESFFVINGDVCWLDGWTPALRRLATAWDPERMDVLLLAHSTAHAYGYDGKAGDYAMDPMGRLRRRREREIAPFIYAGIQILHPRVFENTPDGAFSLNQVYDRAEEAGRLWGLRHDGMWFHVGTPESIGELEDALHHMTVDSAVSR